MADLLATQRFKDRAAQKVKEKKAPAVTLEKRVIEIKPWISGFCGVGSHEGNKILSPKGSLLRSCSGDYVIQGREYRCGCDCHAEMRRIRDMLRAMEEPTDETPLDAPSLVKAQLPPDTYAPTAAEAAIVALGPVNAPVPATTPADPPADPPVWWPPQTLPAIEKIIELNLGTPSQDGRQARGSLESKVRAVCDQYAALGMESGITVGYIKATIQEYDPEYNVSPGAIRAVLDRWVRAGTAVCAANPFRFVKYANTSKT